MDEAGHFSMAIGYLVPLFSGLTTVQFLIAYSKNRMVGGQGKRLAIEL